ncbi:Hypothetical protein CINCED_3A008189 [Cinara cedri]|uniref:Uncharacterized protein n=1 Tax=Cinara cedri TaxID=506608 RepID=A0A5E4NR25_9HEMI|nr:Hypothetical protein CINCED_3A008189 [Cinara cedri]
MSELWTKNQIGLIKADHLIPPSVSIGNQKDTALGYAMASILVGVTPITEKIGT